MDQGADREAAAKSLRNARVEGLRKTTVIGVCVTVHEREVWAHTK